MYELTNAQRLCFGLKPVEPHWVPMTLKPNPYYSHTTIAYRDGLTLRKVVSSGEERYIETELNEQLSEDLKYLLPKTGKGKPVPLTAASLEKRGGTGMCLYWLRQPYNLRLWHEESQHVWYDAHYEDFFIDTMDAFINWVEDWCANTTQADLDAMEALTGSKRVRIKYREGDVFRFRLNRRLWGYGRIVLDYQKMKKCKEPVISPFLSHSLDCAVYHIVTERSDMTVAELEKLPCLPSTHVTDNRIYYGDYEIIGHIPLREKEDWPIMYDCRHPENQVILQCGRLCRTIPGATPLVSNFAYIYSSPWLSFRLIPILLACIEAGSNAPYWAAQTSFIRQDLRDPKHRSELAQVCDQMDLTVEELLPGCISGSNMV